MRNRVTTYLVACIAIGIVGCAHSHSRHKSKLVQPDVPAAQVLSISFTGPGLDGVPTRESAIDHEKGNFRNPDAQPAEDPLITAPEYIAAQVRSEPGFMRAGTRFHVKVVVATITKNIPIKVATISAVCPDHPDLDLPTQPLSAVSPGSTDYQATLQIPAPIVGTHLYEDFIWHWTITIDGVVHHDISNNTIIIGAGSGTWMR